MQYKLSLLSAGFGDRFVELSDGVDSGFSQYSTFFSTTYGDTICLISAVTKLFSNAVSLAVLGIEVYFLI